MKGTGTQIDPFIVDNWEDFVTAVGTSGAYVAFPAGGGVIDMSDRGFFTSTTSYTIIVPILCTHINGNGWRIHGLSWQDCYMFGRSVTGEVTMENLHFTGFYGYRKNLYYATMLYFSKGTIYLSKCSFGGVLDGCAFVYQYQNDVIIKECSMAFNCSNSSSIDGETYTSPTFENCNIKLAGISTVTGVFFDSGSCDFCYFSGDITFAGGNVTFMDDGSGKSITHYSIIDVNITNGKTGATITIDNRGAKIVNTDKIKGFATINLDDNTFAVTEEQLHDAEYLNSIGFSIGVD